MNYVVDLVVGRNLRALREERGLSRAELAAKTDISLTELAAFEDGDARIPPLAIAALGAGLGVPISAFFEGCPEPEPDAPADPSERRLN
jgi:transcriptional regulator with XRE-family HTH domain